VEDDIKIARRAAVRSCFALSAVANSRAVFNPGRNFHFDLALAQRYSLPFALRAWIGHYSSRAVARRASPRDGKEPLLITNLSATCAALARNRRLPGSRAGSITNFAGLVTPNLNFRRYAERSLVELQRNVFAQIGSALCARTPASSTKNVSAEEAVEQIAQVEVLENGGIESAEPASRAADSRMAKLVVALALVLIHQDGVRLAALLELLFRVRIIRIAVRMVLERELAIRALDLHVARRARNAEHLVIVTFGIGGQCGPLLFLLL